VPITVTMSSNKDYRRTFTVYRTMTSCFIRMEHQHNVHATPLLTCAAMCRNSLNGKQHWHSNSPDLNHVEYSVGGTMQKMIIVTKFKMLTS